jgi:hypothetical protein
MRVLERFASALFGLVVVLIASASSERAAALAAPRAAARPRMVQPSPQLRAVISIVPLRRAIRRALTPRVRGCFADARHGSPTWWARADVRLVISNDTVVSSSVSGPNVDAALADCITRGIAYLQVPHSDVVLVVNYPFRSEPVGPARPVRSLGAATEALLDGAVGALDVASLDAEVRATVP